MSEIDKATKKFTKKQIEDWRDYERVRQSGRWNMFFPQARAATGLTREKYGFVMDNYEALAALASVKGESHE